MSAKPTKKQIEWADMEFGVLIHYLAEVYNPGFKGYKTAAVRTELNPENFNPTKLYPRQWVRAAAEAGAKYAVLVANHCSGFSLWPTKVNDYSVASMKWKDGKSDLVREFIDACKEYGLAPGLYYSTGCNGYYDINDEVKQDCKSEKYQNYVACVEKQITELWSEYGELFEIWFDGGIIPKEAGGPDVFSILKKYQPDAITFQGPYGYENNIRWIGNEDGVVPKNCYATYSFGGDSAGAPDGKEWMPAETDFPNRDNRAFGGGWSWKAGEEDHVYSPEELMRRYINSVGRNSNMLIGMAISSDGDFQDEEQFIEFGKLLKKAFEKLLYEDEIKDTPVLTIKNTENVPLSYLVLTEDITNGEMVDGFKVYGDGDEIFDALVIGHKRIIPLDGKAYSEIKLEILSAKGPYTLKAKIY